MQQRLIAVLEELRYVCVVENSLERLHQSSAGAWAIVAEVTPATRDYFDRLTEGLDHTAFCALVAREDLVSVERARNFSHWRLVETPHTDEHFIEQLARALLDKT